MFATWFAQLEECRSAKQEVAGSNPGRTNTQGLQIIEKKDFLVFLDKGEKL